MNDPDPIAGSQEAVDSPAGLKIAPRSCQSVNNSDSTCSSFDDTTHSQASRASQISFPSTNVSVPSLRPVTPSQNNSSNNPEGFGHPLLVSATEASPTQGAKRTATGHIKHSTPAPRSNSVSPWHPAHSRSKSASSPGTAEVSYHRRQDSLNPILVTNFQTNSQLSSDLKARLAYAMVKVHNGWESRTLDEVEKLAAQATSPKSPRPSSYSPSQASITGVAHRSRELHNAISQPIQLSPHREQFSRPTQISAGNPYVTTSQTSPLHTFASPRDPHYNPGLSGQVPPLGARHVGGASTPTPEEQDAVDTLLLMSSPANSVCYGRANNAASTANSSTHVSPTRFTFTKPRSISSGGFGPHLSRPRKSVSANSDGHPTYSNGATLDGTAGNWDVADTHNDKTVGRDFDRLMTELREYESGDERVRDLHMKNQPSRRQAPSRKAQTGLSSGISGVERA